MIDALIRWSLENRLFVLLGAAVLIAWGGYETLRMPVDVFPDLTAPTVTVVAEAHGMAPVEVEALVTFPIETALNGASGVRRVRSSTGIGIAVVWVEFEWGTDIYLARQIVGEKLQLVSGTLPPELDPPVLAPVSSIMGEIMFVAMTSESHSPMEIRATADWIVRRRLLAVPGVAQVVPIGGDVKQFQVLVRPDRLSAFGLTVDAVVDSVGATNENTSAGFYVEGGQEYLIRGIGRVRSPREIEQTVVATRKGQPVLVRDIAEVTVGPALKRGTGSYNGEPAVVIGIQKQPDANTLALTSSIDAVLDDIQSTLPEGMKIHRHIFRQADFIEIAIENVITALGEGALLAVVVVVAFLMSAPATGITILAIPLSLLATVLVLKLTGASINTMTLGGMAIAVGALVDDAIIDVENVVRRLRERSSLSASERPSTFAIVFDASKEIRRSIVFATVIIVLVFLPLFFLSGVEGRLLRPLGTAYIVALTASLVVALTVTPALCSLLLPRSKAVARGDDVALVRRLKALYRPALEFALSRWKAVGALSLLAVALSGWGLTRAGQSFLPDFNEGTLTISVVTLPGTALDESDRLGLRVERALLAHPEVAAVARRTGRAELDEHAQGVNASEMEVNLRMLDRSKAAFLAALRRDFDGIAGANVTIGQPISHRIDHMLSGTRANIAVKLFGPDLHESRRIAGRIESAMRDVRGVVDLSTEQQIDVPFVTIRFDRPALARYGMRVRDAAHVIETAFLGRAVSRVLDGQAAFDLVVRVAPSVLESLDAIRSLRVRTPGGAEVPLHALAEIRRDRGPNTIGREDVQRKIVVMCNVAGRDLVGAVEEIRERIERSVALPIGYHVEYGGQFESATEASRTLLLLGLVVVAAIFALLFVAFRSARDAALVMLNLPLALIGGVIGVYVGDGIVSVAAIIGFITLFGIATRNGLLMVSHIHHLVDAEGVRDPVEAVRRGAVERLAPILMTALAAGLALIPLALRGGEPGSEIQTPMAIVILFGLLSSTFLNMIVVPALYLRFGSIRRVIGTRREEAEAESARGA